MNTQTILDNLEEVIESRNRWYIQIDYTWEFLARVPKDWYFFPKEIDEIVPLDDSQKERIEKARKWFRDNISEKDDDVVSLYEFSKPWPEMKVEPFCLLYRRDFLDSCTERCDRESSLQLGKEMRRLDHVLFLSNDMAENYIKKTCPLLSSCIERWKLLNELREYLQEIRVTGKQSLHT